MLASALIYSVVASTAGAAATSPAGVDVIVAGETSQSASSCDRIAELLDRAAITLRCTGRDGSGGIDAREVVAITDPAPGTIAQVWIDLRTRPDATLYLVDTRAARILVRRVPFTEPPDDVFFEQLGQITATAIEALQAGAVLGLARSEAVAAWGLEPAPAAPPAAPRSAPPRPAARVVHPVRLDLAVGYRVAGWSSQPSLLHGPALALSASDRRHRLQPGAGVSVQWLLPTGFTHPLLDARIDGYDARAWARLDPRVGPSRDRSTPQAGDLAVRSAIGIGVEVMRTRPHGGAVEGALPHVRLWDARPLLSLSLGLDVAATRIVHVQIDGTIDIDLRDTRFVLDDGGPVLFDPWRVRPGIRVAFAFDVLGRGKKPDRGDGTAEAPRRLRRRGGGNGPLPLKKTAMHRDRSGRRVGTGGL